MKNLENAINRGKKNIFFQNINKHKKNVKFDYDVSVTKEFRKEFPEEVKKLEKEAIKKLPYLRYNYYKKFLDKKVDYMIFPPIIEKPDGYFYWEKGTKKSKKGRTAGGYHLQLERHQGEIIACGDYATGGGEKLMDELLKDLLEELIPEEDTLIKMWYGVEPYDPHSEKEIYKNLSDQEKKKLKLDKLPSGKVEEVVKERVNEVIQKLKQLLNNK